MQVIIIESDPELGASLKRAVSLKYACELLEEFKIERVKQGHLSQEIVYLVDRDLSVLKKRTEGEGERAAQWIVENARSRVLLFGFEKAGRPRPFHYLPIPFCLQDLFTGLSEARACLTNPNAVMLSEKYEHFRSKISHDYMQYSAKKWPFYRALLIYYPYFTKTIFGLDIEKACGIDREHIHRDIQEYEKKRDSSILHSLMGRLKIGDAEFSPLQKYSELKKLFIDNAQCLIEAIGARKIGVLRIDKKVALNFFLSWSVWRELGFLEKYNRALSDGFFMGVFRVLLNGDRSDYPNLRNELLLHQLGVKDNKRGIQLIKDELNMIIRHLE